MKVRYCEEYIDCNNNGSVDLYYDNAKKLETYVNGISVTGNISVTGIVDGRDIGTDGTKLDGISSGVIVGSWICT